MERKQEVSKAVIQRLPRYYRNICELKAEGEQRISSKALAERMGHHDTDRGAQRTV